MGQNARTAHFCSIRRFEGCRKTLPRWFPHTSSIRHGFSCRIFLDPGLVPDPTRSVRKPSDSRHRHQPAWPSPEWRNLLFCRQNRADPFRLCPLICQIWAFRAFWPDGEPATPEDAEVAAALRFARAWRRLAELRTWRPLASHDAVGEALAAIGWPADAELVAAWRDREAVPGDPPLVAALRAGQTWIGLAGHDDPLPLDAVFLAACGWRMAGYGEPVALPFWSADAMLLHRQAVQVGPAWLVGALGCVANAATRARAELRRLLAAEKAVAGAMGRTARSRLPELAKLLIRHPVVTAGVAARELDVTQQAAVRLLQGLQRAGLAAEATGRRTFRAWMAAMPRSGR